MRLELQIKSLWLAVNIFIAHEQIECPAAVCIRIKRHHWQWPSIVKRAFCVTWTEHSHSRSVHNVSISNRTSSHYHHQGHSKSLTNAIDRWQRVGDHFLPVLLSRNTTLPFPMFNPYIIIIVLQLRPQTATNLLFPLFYWITIFLLAKKFITS